MKKVLFFGSLFLLAFLFVISCDESKSPEELLKEEENATEQFIEKHEFIILSEYPEDSIFEEKEYYRDPDGIYIHVIDPGNGIKPKLQQTIIGRYDELIYFKTGDTITPYYGPLAQPDQFLYGVADSYGGGGKYTKACEGWSKALAYVSDKAEVSLIIPSEFGTTSDRQLFYPVFIPTLKYELR